MRAEPSSITITKNKTAHNHMITIVSGLPRSGTSLMMRMLEAGGMPLLTDSLRHPDHHNPHGYYEFSPVKRLDQDSSWIGTAEGRAIKIVSPLLQHLPLTHSYRVILMQRPLEQVLASQSDMLGPSQYPTEPERDNTLHRSYARHETEIMLWLRQQSIPAIRIQFQDALENSHSVAERVAAFLEINLEISSMVTVVEPGTSKYSISSPSPS